MNPERAPTPGFSIVATVGPASRGLAKDLLQAGAGALRLNASHMEAAQLARVALDCRASVPGVPIIIDLQGAKMRVGSFAPVALTEGQRLNFALSPARNEIPLPHPEIFRSVSQDETLTCDDDRLRFRVLAVCEDRIEAVALCQGTLRPHKGINVVEHPLHPQRLTRADVSAISFTSSLTPVAYAFSFMEDGRECAWVREQAPASAVIGKVERREAVRNVQDIAAASDAVWICRGDLGAQLGIAAMARWVADFEPGRCSVPVLMAGQVFEHMTEHLSPTRSEACHVFDLCRRGYAGFVLSDETAIGRDPLAAVSALRSLLDSF